MNQINFLPSTYVQMRTRQHRVLREAVWVALTVIVIAGWYFNTRGNLKELEAYAHSVEVQAAAAHDQRTEVLKIQAQQQGLLDQVHLQRELGLPVNLSVVIANIAKLMPPSIALTGLNIEAPRPTPEPVVTDRKSAPPARQKTEASVLKVEMVGLAPADTDVADFVGKISGNPLFNNVKMLFSRATQTANLQAREFRIEMDVSLDREYKPAGGSEEVASAD